MLAFHCKDALLVIDDFAPHGSAHKIAQLHADADRVFGAVGNHAGRNRLDSGANLREGKPPRALILSTGEEIPRGQSCRARALIIEICKGAISREVLTKCQATAKDGLYMEAMAGFIRWFAANYEDRIQQFKNRVTELRARALEDEAVHARTPDLIASLQAANEMRFQYAEEIGAIDSKTHASLRLQSWGALRDAASAQDKHQIAAEPAEGLIKLIRSAVSSGKAHLADRGKGGEPTDSPESCGWRSIGGGPLQPQGSRIGWLDGDHIYLDPVAAYQVAQSIARDLGDPIPISEQTMNKRLHEKGYLASIDKTRHTLTIRRVIAGSRPEVLHLRRTTLLSPADEED